MRRNRIGYGAEPPAGHSPRLTSFTLVHDQRSFLQQLAANTDTVLWKLDTSSLRFTDFNAAVEAMLGYTLREALGLGIDDVLVAHGRAGSPAQRLGRWIDEHLASGRSRSRRDVKLRLRHKSGHNLRTETLLLLIGESRQGVELLGETRVVPDAGRRLVARHDGREQWEATPLAVFMMERCRIAWASEQALRLVGATFAGEVIGRALVSFVAPEERPRLRARLRLLAHPDRRPPDEEMEFRRCDGQVVPVVVSSARRAGREQVIFVRDISIKRKALAALRESEERFRGLVEASPEAILIHHDGRIAYSNRAAQHLCRSRSAEVLAGTDLESIVKSEHWQDFARHLAATGDAGPRTHESVLCAADGIEVPVEITHSRMRFNGREAYVLFARDLSQLRDAATRLRKRDALLQSIYRVAPVSIGIVADRMIVDANAMFGRVLGFAPGERLQFPVERLYPDAAEYRRVGEELRRQTAGGGVGRVATRWRRRDGWLIDVEISSTRLNADPGAVECVFVAQDVSPWVDAQRTLAANEAELRVIYDGAPIMLMLLDGAAHCRRLNRWAEQFTGVRCADAVGRRFDRVLGCVCRPADPGEEPWPECCEHCVLTQALRRAAAGEATYRTELSVGLERESVRREVTLLVSAMPLKWEGGEHVLLCLEDITEHKRLAEQFQQAQKLDLIGQLAAGIAHDFNNIFFALAMHLGLLQHQAGAGSALRRELVELEEQARLGNRLCQKLLILGRRQTLHQTRVEVGAIVDQALRVVRHRLAPGIRTGVTAAGGPQYILGDPGMLEQILINLCLNAGDAMPQGGAMQIGIAPLTCAGLRRGHPARPFTGNYIVLTVSDTGCGMDAATQQRIFDPFFSTKEANQGTGLGLTTVRTIVERHQGWVEVTSKPGAGATFEVGLPAAPVSPAS
jgi:two-component system, cell cycle sensor histidine kinase and response regulator CckA